MKCKLYLGCWNGSLNDRDFVRAIECNSEDDAMAIFRARKTFWATLGYVPYGCFIKFSDGSKKPLD